MHVISEKSIMAYCREHRGKNVVAQKFQSKEVSVSTFAPMPFTMLYSGPYAALQ